MFVAGIDAHATYSVIAIVSNTGLAGVLVDTTAVRLASELVERDLIDGVEWTGSSDAVRALEETRYRLVARSAPGDFGARGTESDGPHDNSLGGRVRPAERRGNHRMPVHRGRVGGR